MEIKIQCPCGARFAFDAEPVGGCMTSPVACPECGEDATQLANDFIRRQGSADIAPPPSVSPGLQLKHHEEKPAAKPESSFANVYASAALASSQAISEEAEFINPLGRRPGSVTTVSVLLMIYGGLRFLVIGIVVAVALWYPEMREKILERMSGSWFPPSVLIAMQFVDPVVTAVCGFLALKGENYARFVLGGWIAISLPFTFNCLPIGLIFKVVCLFLLLRPEADAFFKSKRHAE